MGREQKRKQEKNYKKRINEEDIKLFTVSGAVKTVVGVALVLLVSYFILAFFVTKELKTSNKKSDTTESGSSTVSNQILASKIFDQGEESYYVYFYDFNKEDDKLASSIGNISDTVYRVNTASGFNSNYVASDKGNSGAKDLSSLKVINPTLIKINNDTIVEYYEGVSDILNHLNK